MQLTWRGAPAGPVAIHIGGRRIDTETEEGPGATVIDELSPGTDGHAELSFSGGPPVELSFRTLDALPGPARCRVVTISDLHLGLRSFGLRRRITDTRPGQSSGFRCARAALAEAAAFDPDLIVVKGDVTNAGRRIEWRQAAELLAEVEVPVVVLPGNHELAPYRTIEPWQAAEEFGIHVVRGVEWIDLAGIRVVMGTTLVIGRSRGRIDHHGEELIDAAADCDAALVVLHHHLEHRPDPFFWPPGIPRSQARPFLVALGAAQPAALVTSGHTHRHRRHQVGPLNVTQVGSTKDYPGVWAGYEVHDSGLSQFVRRVGDPECLRWTEKTRQAMGGYWGRTAPGSLDDRCFTVRWAR